MAVDYTTTALVANVKRRISAPTTQSLFDPDDICALATDELQDTIYPLIMSVRKEFFVKSLVLPIDPSNPRYGIPGVGAGMKLREVDITSSLGDGVTTTWVNLQQINREDANSSVWTNTVTGWPSGFYIENNDVILFPAQQTVGYIRLTFFKRSPALVTTSKAGQVVNIDVGALEVSVSLVPSAWAVGDTVNAESPVSPFPTNAEDLEITAINGNVLTLDSVDGIEVGDWICFDGETVIPPVMVEARGLLAQATAVKILESMDNAGPFERAQKKYDSQAESFLTLITPRDDASVQKVTSIGSGIAYWNSGSSWGGWGGGGW